LACRRM